MKLPKIVYISAAGFIFALFYVITSAKTIGEIKPLREPPQKAFEHTLAGMGIVEALDENITVAPNYSGKVAKVLVREGQQVKKGEPLYELDYADLNAKIASLTADAEAQAIKIERMKNAPRDEDVQPIKAAVKQTQANYENIKNQWTRLKNVTDQRAVNQDELSKKYFEMKKAEAEVEKSKADLNRILAGEWSFDIEQAEAQLESLRAKIDEVKIQIERATVKAPRSGEVLKVNIRDGEFVSVNADSEPVILGSSKKLQVRVDIDEINASDLKPNAKAIATLKGNADKKFTLKFVRIQPYMVPKTNLSGRASERVDVRVLQVIYEFNPPEFPVYVGQQVDVSVDNK